jgi:hypothetical protein
VLRMLRAYLGLALGNFTHPSIAGGPATTASAAPDAPIDSSGSSGHREPGPALSAPPGQDVSTGLSSQEVAKLPLRRQLQGREQVKRWGQLLELDEQHAAAAIGKGKPRNAGRQHLHSGDNGLGSSTGPQAAKGHTLEASASSLGVATGEGQGGRGTGLPRQAQQQLQPTPGAAGMSMTGEPSAVLTLMRMVLQ